MTGALLYSVLFFLFDTAGSKLIEFTLFAIGFLLFTGISYVEVMHKIRGRFNTMGLGMQEQWKGFSKLLRPAKNICFQGQKSCEPRTASSG